MLVTVIAINYSKIKKNYELYSLFLFFSSQGILYTNSLLTGHRSRTCAKKPSKLVEIDDILGPRWSNFDFAGEKDDLLKKKFFS